MSPEPRAMRRVRSNTSPGVVRDQRGAGVPGVHGSGSGSIIAVTMKGMSVIPGRRGSELIAESPDPPPAEGSVLAEGLLVGICGTDREVLRGHGLPPDGGQRLVIGHESLGRVLEAPPGPPGPPPR